MMEMETLTDDILLESVFPREVWQLVLQNVESLASYQKICSSSPFFDRLSTPSHIKVKALFPSVLPFLVDYLKDNSVKIEDGGRYFYSVYKHVIKLRKICHDWKNGVDSLVQSFCEANIFNDEVEEAAIHIYEPYQWFLGFSVDEEFQFFREDFDTLYQVSKMNPIISRGIYIKFDREGTEQQQFLQTYGHHILYCALNLGDISECSREEYMRERYTWVCGALKHLPNLKRLCIVALGEHNNVKGTDFQDNGRADEQDTEGHHNCLPKLEKLQSVTLQDYEDPIGNDILKSHPQITVLQLISHGQFTPKLLEFDLPHVTELAIKFSGDNVQIESDLQLVKESTVSWKVTKLNINTEEEDVSWKLLFDTLSQKFGATLKELEISLPNPDYIDKDAQLVLPQMEKLHVIMEKYVTIDFILPMKNNLLEFSMTVFDTEAISDNGNGTEGENRNVVQFYKFRNQMWRSNIWEMFPKLKKTRYEKSVVGGYRWISCHRFEWRDFANNKV